MNNVFVKRHIWNFAQIAKEPILAKKIGDFTKISMRV